MEQTDKEKLISQGYLECSDCHKYYKKLESCKDGKSRCKKCKKKIPTNKFYNPNWRTQNQFVGKFNMSNQERSLLITEKIKKGMSLNQAKKQVNMDILQLKKNKCKKYYEEKYNLEKKRLEKELNKEFLKGLGQKKK